MQATNETVFGALYPINAIITGRPMVKNGWHQEPYTLFGTMALVLGLGEFAHTAEAGRKA